MNRNLIIYRALPIILFLWGLVNSAFHLSNNNPQGILWFCNTLIFLLAIGLWLNSKPILGSVTISYLLFGILWTTDIVAWFSTGKFLFDVSIYIASSTILGRIITFYHILLLAFSLRFIIKEKKLYSKAWIISSIHLLIVLLLSLILTDSNVNCVRQACDIGKLGFIYLLKPAFVPFILFNWIMFTIIVFIPMQLILNNFKKPKRSQN